MTQIVRRCWIGSLVVASLLSASVFAQDKRENPQPNAMDFATKLFQEHSYLMTHAEAVAVSEIFRQMREAQGPDAQGNG